MFRSETQPTSPSVVCTRTYPDRWPCLKSDTTSPSETDVSLFDVDVGPERSAPACVTTAWLAAFTSIRSLGDAVGFATAAANPSARGARLRAPVARRPAIATSAPENRLLHRRLRCPGSACRRRGQWTC